MQMLIEAASKFFSLSAIVGYLIGAVNAVVIVWLMDRRRHTDRLHSMKLMAVVWAVMILFVGYVAVGIERNTVCIVEVLGTLATRAKLSDDADAKSDVRDQSVVQWIRTKDNPPPQIAKLKWESQTRQDWIHAQDDWYIGQILGIQAERRATLKDRASQQLPENRCGRN